MTSVTIMPVPVAYNDAIHFFNLVGVLQLHTIDTTMEISACRFFTFDFPHLSKIKIYMHLLQQRREQYMLYLVETTNRWPKPSLKSWTIQKMRTCKFICQYIKNKKNEVRTSLAMYLCEWVRRKLEPDDMATLSPPLNKSRSKPCIATITRQHPLGLI